MFLSISASYYDKIVIERLMPKISQQINYLAWPNLVLAVILTAIGKALDNTFNDFFSYFNFLEKN